MLKREKQPMLGFIEDVLKARKLFEDYIKRPDYQKNDYISWIARAKQDKTKNRRLYQMLDELEMGGVYMGMEHPPSRKQN